MKILFLAANPVDVVTRLRVDEEIREISQKIRLGTFRDQLELVPELAVRVSDLQAALLRHQPDIVHFSGHGSQTSGIVLEDEAGNRKVVSRTALSALFRILKDNIRVVVFNACYAKDQARILSETIDFTIGMNDTLDDRAAITFASYFYQSLAFGRSVEESFDLAVNQLDLESLDGARVPELLVREGVSAARSRIVAPADRAASIENPWGFKMVTADQASAVIGGQATRGVAKEERAGKSRAVGFLPWLFASVSVSLTVDALRRFLTSDGSSWDIAATFMQPFLIAFAVLTAVLSVAAFLRPPHPLRETADRSGRFTEPPKARRAAFLTATIAAAAFGLWLSLPAFAHYFNEKGIEFQYREPPDLSQACAAYRLAVRLRPDYAQAHYNLAAVNEDLHPEKAMAEYMLAIRYDSHMYLAYNNLARLYLRRGKDKDYDSALSLLSQAGDLSPQDESVQYSLNKNLGWAHYGLKQYPLAEGYLRRAIWLGNRQGAAAAHCLLAYVLREQGKAGVADECFDCVSLAPGQQDVEARWVSDAQDCLMKGKGK